MGDDTAQARKRRKFDRLFGGARVVIFDFDGVLVDSEKYHFAAYRDVFARYGHEVDEVEYYKYWTSLGHGAKGEIERHGLDLDPERIKEEKRPVFSRYCRDGTIELFPEAVELVKRLSRAGKTLAVASGTIRPDIEAILGRAGLLDAFSYIVGSDTVPAIKPNPEIFVRVLDALAVEPYECVVIEDAEKGMNAAVAAHIPVVVVRTRETAGIDFGLADLTLESHAEMIALARASFPG